METKDYRDRLKSLCQEIIEDIRDAVLATPDHKITFRAEDEDEPYAAVAVDADGNGYRRSADHVRIDPGTTVMVAASGEVHDVDYRLDALGAEDLLAIAEGIALLREEHPFYDDGGQVVAGDRVHWNDPALAEFPQEERERRHNAEWTVASAMGETILITTDGSEAEVPAHELIPIR